MCAYREITLLVTLILILKRARERESERARDATSAAAWLLCPGTTCRFGARAASTAAVEYDATTSTDDAANAGVVGGNGWRRSWW